MYLKECIQKIKKEGCPDKCEFKNKRQEPVVIPPPDKIEGVLISRDPTIAFYEDTYEKNINNRAQLFTEGVPSALIKKIYIFMKDKFSEDDKRNLEQVMNNRVYWTHLLKCPTDNSEKITLRFSKKHAEICADKWLNEELSAIIKDNPKLFIITLGNEVKEWINKWKEKNENICKEIKVFNLIHHSNQNIIIWNRYAMEMIKQLENQIEGLKSICNFLSNKK